MSASDRRFPLPLASMVLAAGLSGSASSSGAQLANPAPSPPPGVRSERRPILLGSLSRANLKTAPFSEWFESQYVKYEPNRADIDKLREPIQGLAIEAFFGTWCGDSRRQIPRLLKVLDAVGFDEKRLALVGLSDRDMEFKQAPGRPELERLVHRTPTVVLLRDGVEIGRIVETPATTLEADLLAIVEGRGPEPKYGAEAFVHRLFAVMSGNAAVTALAAAEAEIARLSEPGSLGHYAEYDLLRNGRAADAKALLDLHLKIDPKSVSGHLLMSEALEALGRKGEAVAAVERALALEPANDRALKLAARLRAQ